MTVKHLKKKQVIFYLETIQYYELYQKYEVHDHYLAVKLPYTGTYMTEWNNYKLGAWDALNSCDVKCGKWGWGA